jgi:hypothetical protein
MVTEQSNTNGSLVMKAIRYYNTKRLESTQRRVPRLPGSTGIFLSEATGCPRKASLRLLKYTAAKGNEFSQTAMLGGIKGEEKVILILEAAGWDVTRQYTLQTRWGNGKIDALIDARDGVSSAPMDLYVDRPIVVEIKTYSGDIKWLPRREHVDQCLLYMGLLHLEDNGPVPFGEVTYLLKKAHDDDKENDKIASYPVEWNPERFQYLTHQLDLIDDHVKRGEPVPLTLAGEKSADKPPCQYPNAGRCVYYHHCYGAGTRQLVASGQTTMEF